jgi:hypothetical protein
MSNLPDNNFPSFMEAAKRLRDGGYYVINPAEMNDSRPLAWEDYLRADLQLLFHCDGIALLPGWEKSRGAKLELAVAIQLGMFVMDAITMQPMYIKNDLVFT